METVGGGQGAREIIGLLDDEPFGPVRHSKALKRGSMTRDTSSTIKAHPSLSWARSVATKPLPSPPYDALTGVARQEPDIDLRCEDVGDMLASLPDGCADLVVADPPWSYSGGIPTNTGKGGVNVRGYARSIYTCMTEELIATDLAAAYRIAKADAYMGVWCTFPKLMEWARHDVGDWHYVTGAAWGKVSRGIGVGFHFRGDAELLLLYKRGNPKPLSRSNSNLWLTPRTAHSEKPQQALRALVSMAAPQGGLVVDLYAGASASLAIACRSLGRRYVGAEISEKRHALAMLKLSQQEFAFT